MAQNLVINGITYNGVESLSIVKSGGGKAEYIDKAKYPILGSVDANNNIILTGELADGTYTVMIGDTVVGSYSQGITYTNVLAIAGDGLGGIYHDCGYIDGFILGSYTGVVGDTKLTAKSGYFTTGFIPYTNKQAQNGVPFYIKGVEINASSPDQNMRYGLTLPNDGNWFGTGVFDPSAATSFKITKLGDKYYCLQPNYGVYTYQAWNNKSTTHIRFSFTGSGAGVIITIDEPIE